MAQESHDDRQGNALLVEVHGLGLAQHVAVNALGNEGQALWAVRAALLSTAAMLLDDSRVGMP